MDNLEKLEALKEWLAENGHKYVENVEFAGQRIDLLVKYPKVAVKIADSGQEFFMAMKHKAAPFFIRDTETADFIIEKMTNCIGQSLEKTVKRAEELKEMDEQRKKSEEAQKALHRRKRVRIPRAEKVISGE